MIYVNKANISNDGKELYLDIETVNSENRIETLTLWTQNTFKNYDQAIDLSSYLSQVSNRELITVRAEDIDFKNFEGLIFIEAEDNDEEESPTCSNCSNIKLIILTNFNKFYKCMSDELNKINLNDCIGSNSSCCSPKGFDKVILMELLLEGVKMNLAVGRYGVSVELMKKLNKLCRNCMDININSTAHCTTCNN